MFSLHIYIVVKSFSFLPSLFVSPLGPILSSLNRCKIVYNSNNLTTWTFDYLKLASFLFDFLITDLVTSQKETGSERRI
jgi:hypothetical protein